VRPHRRRKWDLKHPSNRKYIPNLRRSNPGDEVLRILD
jgi:hypothetical protein